MFMLGFVKFFIFMFIIFLSVVVSCKAKSWRRLTITTPITFLLLMIVERLF
ncbi:hypothetical protein PQE66_gp021 [Bacillus phage PBC2]|uniref:Uncharacterized protein n=1 Tax=Bacillus phage PBC2 TaxID=1675029 RepID=A0A218KBS1_9CAUD|nr:hypothetical protein PQE66_gp021 [Bacillus phage PBC2]AKQ08336.1 hypothetical protein PBC2_021 [Bacillus phage PBC2]